MATVAPFTQTSTGDPLRQARIDRAGVISKTDLQYSLLIFFFITTAFNYYRFRGRAPAKRLDDFLAIFAAFAAWLGTGMFLYKLPIMYVMEAANMRRIQLSPEEIESLRTLVKWTLVLTNLIWLSVFSSQLSLLCTFSKSVLRLSKSYHYYFRAVAAVTAGVYVFRSTYMMDACSLSDWGDSLECMTTYPMFPGSRDEPHDQFISSLSGKLDILSDCLVFSFIIVIRSCATNIPTSKITLLAVIFLFVLKAFVSALRVSVTHPIMVYAYTWSIYWQTLEAYILLIAGSVIVRSPIFEIPEQPHMDLSAQDDVQHKGESELKAEVKC